MQYVAVFLLHNTTHHYQALYQISESVYSCWEIFDRKNVHMYYLRVTEGKIEKRRQNKD